MKKIRLIAITIWESFCLFSIALAYSTHDSVGIFVFLAMAPFIAVLIHKAADKPKQTKYGNNSIETKPEIPQPNKSFSVSEFTAIQIETYNRQFKESYDLIMNSKNTETVLRRLSFIDKVYVDLKRTSGANKSWSYYQKLYETINNDRETIINNAIKRGYEEELSKASDLSTNSGRINHMKNYIDKVMQLKELPDNCKAYADTFYDNIEQEIASTKQQDLEKYEDIDKEWRERSDKYYAEHLKNIEAFDPFNVDPNITAEDFSDAELNFLEYMHYKPVLSPDIAQYWSSEYNLGYVQTMSKFFNTGYLRITTAKETLPKLKVPELKKILKANNLPVSGKKEELLERIKSNISTDDLEKSIPGDMRYYCMTSAGSKEAITAVPIRKYSKPPTLEELKTQTMNSLQYFANIGVTQYEFIATLDTETCPICGELDKKVFNISDAKIGVNCPPMHNGCRCTIAPYSEDSEEIFGSGERAARDPNTGKTVYIPDISYTEWKQKYQTKL